MLSGPDLTLAVALHHERIAAARRHRVVNQARRAHKERETDATRQRRASTAPSDGPIQSPRDPRLAHWLIRVGDVVAHYPIAELDGHRRPALGALVDELLNAARARGADVPSNAVAEDSAVVLLRTLGRLAASTAGRSFRCLGAGPGHSKPPSTNSSTAATFECRSPQRNRPLTRTSIARPPQRSRPPSSRSHAPTKTLRSHPRSAPYRRPFTLADSAQDSTTR